MGSKFFEKPKSLGRRLHAEYSLLNWILGNAFVALGVAISTKADFGLSMIGAGPYVLHVWLRESLPWFTQGTAEYFYEFFVMVVTCIIVREVKLKYMLVFIEAIFIGFLIDGWFLVFGGNGSYESVPLRLATMAGGLIITALGVAFFFRTELPLQAFDFAVVKTSMRYNLDQKKTKQVADAIFFAAALALSLLLTHRLTGIGIATVLATVLNAPLINLWGKLIDRLEPKTVENGDGR